MRTKGITFKLFVMTVLCFLCFYGMVILSQLLFFDSFYQNQKTSRVEAQLKTLSARIGAEDWRSSKALNEVRRFMLRNKSQFAVVTMDGRMEMDDPYQLKLQQGNGQFVVVPLSMFMSQYGVALHNAAIKVGDPLTITGERENDTSESPIVLFPYTIEKQGVKRIGHTADGESIQVSGVAVEVTMPALKTMVQGQGLLLEALDEWFPLSPAREAQLERLEVVKEEWTDSWSGLRNAIIVKPQLQSSGEIELLFSVTSLQEISDANAALRLFYLYLGIGGIILILVLALFFSKLVARPLIILNQTAKRMVQLDFTAHAGIRQKDELGSLSDNLFILSQNLDTALLEVNEANHQLLADMEHKKKLSLVQQEFFSNASHELKTPLSIIKSFAEGLQDGVGLQKQDHYIQVIIDESNKMQVLVNDMLDLAILDSGTIELRKTSFMVSDLAEKVIEKLVHLLQAKNVQAAIMPANEMPIFADMRWMEQVLTNFVTNAIRHADEGSVILIGIESSADHTTFYVENKGERLPAEQLEQVWERFYRGELSRSRLTGGTGLGLSIVKLILELHQFNYKAENTADGVRFTVTAGKYGA
jgi:two-component system sensor histidine kinase VanS